MDIESKLRDVLQWALDVIEDLVSIFIAVGLLLYGWLVDQTLFQNDPLLWSGVVMILIVMAIGNLRDRRRRFHEIQDTVEETLQEVRGNKIYEVAGADRFFKESREVFQEDAFSTASTIDISGITLSGAVAQLRDQLIDNLKANAKVRVMMLDSSRDDSLKQLVKRSWSKKARAKKYEAMLENSSDLLEEIGSEPELAGSFEIGYLPFIPSVGMTIVDAKKDCGTAFVEVYHQLKRGSPSFCVTAREDPESFAFYVEQFKLMWDECKTKKIV